MLSIAERERLAKLAIARLSPSELLEVWRLLVSPPEGSRACPYSAPGSIALQSLRSLIAQLQSERLEAVVEHGSTASSIFVNRLKGWVAAAFPMSSIGHQGSPPQCTRRSVMYRAPSAADAVSALYAFLFGRDATAVELERAVARLGQANDWTALLAMLPSLEQDSANTEPHAAVPSDLLLLTVLCGAIVGRGIHPREGAGWLTALDSSELDRRSVIAGLVRAAEHERMSIQSQHESGSCTPMGSNVSVSVAEWHSRARERPPGNSAPAAPFPRARFQLVHRRAHLVTAIASLYRGGAYIEHFLENIISQTIFREACELIIVDAASPDGEASIIERYAGHHPNIRLLRLDRRIGIYDAWNLAIAEARGEYLTNTNVDDVRRHDSLELQAATLESLPGIDVVYQNFLYSLAPNTPYEVAAAVGIKSQLPLVGHSTLLCSNPPHNAPMWRRRLHDELGLFDTSYRSAGDLEFWLRCVCAGKAFFKLDDPHVVYFHNPEGASTRSDSPGTREAREIGSAYARVLMSYPEFANLREFDRVFMQGVPSEEPLHRHDRRVALQQRLRQIARRLKYPT